MLASTSGLRHGIASGKSLKCTELPSERLRYIASAMKGTNGAISRLTVDSVSYRV